MFDAFCMQYTKGSKTQQKNIAVLIISLLFL